MNENIDTEFIIYFINIFLPTMFYFYSIIIYIIVNYLKITN